MLARRATFRQGRGSALHRAPSFAFFGPIAPTPEPPALARSLRRTPAVPVTRGGLPPTEVPPMRRPLLAAAAAAALACPAGPVLAQGAFSFLRLDAAPRGAALAGALDAVPTDDPAALFANPAFVSDATRGAALAYVNHLDAFSAGNLAVSRPMFGRDWAVGVRYFGYGTMDETDVNGEKTGTFGASSVALSLATAQEVMPGLRAGASVGVVTTGIADARATALSADLGVAYQTAGQLTLGATLRNAGAVVSSLGTVKDALPLDLRVSVSKRLRHLPLLLTATGVDLTNPGAGPAGRSAAEQVLGHVAVGAELQPGSVLRLRAGFSPRRNQELATGSRLDLAGLGLGLGLKVKGFTVDYGFSSWSENGALHFVGVRRGF